MSDPRRVTGLLLIAGGLLWVLVVATGMDGTVVVPGVGVAFLAAYLATRNFGLLVPGGILTGLGAGLVFAARGGPGEAVVLGLGLGFVSITVLDAVWSEGQAAWWPLIPGGVLVLVGGTQIAGVRDLGIYLVPAALVAAGLLLILRARSASPGGPTSPTGDGDAGQEQISSRLEGADGTPNHADRPESR